MHFSSSFSSKIVIVASHDHIYDLNYFVIKYVIANHFLPWCNVGQLCQWLQKCLICTQVANTWVNMYKIPYIDTYFSQSVIHACIACFKIERQTMCIDELGQIQVPSIECRHDGETYFNQIIILLRYNICNLIMILFSSLNVRQGIFVHYFLPLNLSILCLWVIMPKV